MSGGNMTKINEAEKRQTWLAFATAAIAGGLDDRASTEEVVEDATEIANAMLDAYLETFDEGYEREEREDEEEDERPRKGRRR
jgi:hypothetical protein